MSLSIGSPEPAPPFFEKKLKFWLNYNILQYTKYIQVQWNTEFAHPFHGFPSGPKQMSGPPQPSQEHRPTLSDSQDTHLQKEPLEKPSCFVCFFGRCGYVWVGKIEICSLAFRVPAGSLRWTAHSDWSVKAAWAWSYTYAMAHNVENQCTATALVHK